MSRSIDEPAKVEEENIEISNSEIYDMGMAIFFSMEEIHAKIDAITAHLGLKMPTNTGESPEN